MFRLRRWYVLAALVPLFGLYSHVLGDEPKAAEEKWLIDRALTVTPRAAPVPAFKYRLFPLWIERKDGNAAPIYLRFAHERNDSMKKELQERPDQWNALAVDKIPLVEAQEFLGKWRYNLRQMEIGARRKTADWNYTLDMGSLVEILLPDIQEMRMQAKLLVLKARVEIAEGKFADAVRTLETGFAFSQQLGDGSILISCLVGFACVNMFSDCLFDLLERPDAPNLYWALTDLPQPLIDLRKAKGFEQKWLELQFPDLAELDRPRSPDQWEATLQRVRKEFKRILDLDKESGKTNEPKPGTTAADPASKSPDLPMAKQYLVDAVGMKSRDVESMPPAQVLLLFFAELSKELRDDHFKAANLPYVIAKPILIDSGKRRSSAPDTEARRLVQMLIPALDKVALAQLRVERRIDALRVIEALRMHAAANRGQLPESLEQVRLVPVPNDPGTGKPFEYHKEGETATLISRLADEPLATTGMRFRITMKK